MGGAPGRSRRSWIWPLLLVLGWLVIGGVTGPYAGRLAEVQSNDTSTFLPSDAESIRVMDLRKHFQDRDVDPAIVVYASDTELGPRARDAALDDAHALGKLRAVVSPVVGPVPSHDGKAIELVVPLSADLGSKLPDVVEGIRARVSDGLPPGVHAYVTGPAGLAADLVGAFAGIDGILLLVAVAVVLVILVIVYRSPLLPVVVLLSAVFALALASGVVYLLADRGALTLNGQSQGILFILVVGAATDYALLLTSRFREELREEQSRFAAMRVAWRQSLGPIGAAGGTVVAGLLCLLLSNLNSTASLGPVAALGIVAALLSALTFLPAVLLLLGRAAFWPARPLFGSEHPERAGVWGRVAALVGARPRMLWLTTTVGLIVLAAFLPTLKAAGTSQTDLFLDKVESVAGQQVLANHFPAGVGSPAVIIGPAEKAASMATVASKVTGVAEVSLVGPGGRPVPPGQPPKEVDGLVEVDATLAAPADSEQAVTAVSRLREAEHAAVEGARVGGFSAITLDTRTAAEQDRRLIIPVVLAVILVLLMLLLRSILAPVLLVVSVVLSFTATLGVAALVFNHLLHLPGADPSVPLYAFVFLVALGVDYNIFLMTRVREETVQHGTRDGVLRALTVTGGVITSAGVVLAATFSALAVIPILFLAQIAFLVGFGVLLDTFVVRSLLVPAAAYDLGSPLWWPSRLARLDRRGESHRHRRDG